MVTLFKRLQNSFYPGANLPFLYVQLSSKLVTSRELAHHCQHERALIKALLRAGNQDCPGAEGTHYPGTVAFQGADPDRYQSSLNYVQTGVLSARECHERGHAMAVASKLGVHANDLTNINTLQIPQATLLPTSTSVYYGVIENGRCEMHTLAPNGGDFTVGSPFLGWSTCVHA